MIAQVQSFDARALNGDGKALLPETPISAITRRRLSGNNSETACMAMKIARRTDWLLLLLLLPTAGCHRYLVATPNLLQHPEAREIYAACPEDCQTAEA